MQMTAAVVRGIPCFFSDGLRYDLPALIDGNHTLRRPYRTRASVDGRGSWLKNPTQIWSAAG
jgi:hypothetical protein